MTLKNLNFAHISVKNIEFVKIKIAVRTYQKLVKSGVRIVVWKPPHAYVVEPDLDVFRKLAAKYE